MYPYNCFVIPEQKNNTNANTDCDENLEPEQHLGLLMPTLHDKPEPEKY